MRAGRRRNPGNRRPPNHALQVIMDRADNGNEFLCESCRFGRIRSGQQTQLEVWCTNGDYVTGFEGSERVPFPVSKCDGFARVDPSQPTRAEYESLEKQAWYIVRSDEGRGLTLVSPDVAKQRGIFDDD